MIPTLTRAGLGAVGPLDAFLDLAQRHGFGAVDPDGEELAVWLGSQGLAACQDALARRQLRLGAIGLAVEWRDDEATFNAGLPALVRQAQAAAALGVKACVTYVLPATDQPAARFLAAATRRLRTAARVLGAFGLRLGLEQVSPHHLRTLWKNPLLWDQPGLLDWVDAIGETNVGLLLDPYHWYTSGADPADLAALSDRHIVHVHFNDAKDGPVEALLDNDRVYPGEGVIPLTAYLQGLSRAGYTGFVSQEVLTRTPPAEAPDVLAARSAAAFRKFGAFWTAGRLSS